MGCGQKERAASVEVWGMLGEKKKCHREKATERFEQKKTMPGVHARLQGRKACREKKKKSNREGKRVEWSNQTHGT